ncbi:hypothetical protein ABZ402_28895 [Streptomyces mirabilis]|uniref:hypothetical protein n=1 Tax=Streptomyces mirabilis TaxID=68239 RepID=UPI0033DC8417
MNETETEHCAAELLMPGSGNASTADMARAGAAPEPFVREESRTATLPRRPVSLAEDRVHAEASSTPMPGPTAEWFYLDTQPFSNDYATP